MRIIVYTVSLILLTGCSAIADYAASSLIPAASKGGVSAELVIGDKENTLGTNQEVDAESIDKVVGTSDNSIKLDQADNVQVTNNTVPSYLVPLLLLLTIIALMLPTPTTMWKSFTSWRGL